MATTSNNLMDDAPTHLEETCNQPRDKMSKSVGFVYTAVAAVSYVLLGAMSLMGMAPEPVPEKQQSGDHSVDSADSTESAESTESADTISAQ